MSRTGPELRTSRLLLRRWYDGDREPFARMNADPVVMEHFPGTLTPEQSERLIERIEATFEEQGFEFWAVEDRSTGEFLGFTGLAVPTFHAAWMADLPEPLVEIGWRLRRESWGHGYATEAARAALRFAVNDLALPAVVSVTTVGNVRSRAVMERLGMRFRAHYDHPTEGGGRVPSVVYHVPRETVGWGRHDRHRLPRPRGLDADAP